MGSVRMSTLRQERFLSATKRHPDTLSRDQYNDPGAHVGYKNRRNDMRDYEQVMNGFKHERSQPMKVVVGGRLHAELRDCVKKLAVELAEFINVEGAAAAYTRQQQMSGASHSFETLVVLLDILRNILTRGIYYVITVICNRVS